MTAYCNLQDVVSRAARHPSPTATSSPTVVQTQDIIDGIAFDIDTKLAGCGLSAPVTTPASFVSYLKALNTWGATAEYLKARFVDQGGPYSESSWKFYEDRYQAGMLGLCARAEGIVGVGSAITGASYWTRNPSEDEYLGANAEPRIAQNEQW